MPLNTQPFEVRSFLGGLTDHQNTDVPNTYLSMDNLLFDGDGEVFVRYGSVVYNNARLPSGNQRVSKIINYNDDEALMIVSGSRVFYDNAGTWTEILSPSGGVALPGASASSNFQSNQWKRQVFITSDSQIQPVKIIKDDSSGWRSITAGLPKMVGLQAYNPSTALTSACGIANELKSKFLAHMPSLTYHLAADNTSAASLPVNATDLATLLSLTNALISAYVSHYTDTFLTNKWHYKVTGKLPFENIGFVTLAAWQYVSQSDQTLFSTESATDLESAVLRLNDIRKCYYAHALSKQPHVTRDNTNTPTSSNPFLDNIVTGPYVSLDKTYIYNLANTLSTKFLAHIASGGAGAGKAHPTAVDTADAVYPNSGGTAASTPETLTNLLMDLAGCYYAHEFDAAKNAGWSYHNAKESYSHAFSWISSAPGFPGGESMSDYFLNITPGQWVNICSFLDEFSTSYNGHVDDWVAHYTALTFPSGNHDSNSAPGTQTILSGGLLANYLYAVVYSYSYTINGFQFTTKSEPYYFEASSVLSINLEPAIVSNISPLVNSSTNYDVSNVVIEIYRTVNNGTTYFLSGTLANTGSTGLSYIDSVKDSDLVNRETLYTNGGASPNSLPPKAKFSTINGNTGYYGNFPGYSNRIIQSQPSIIDGAYGSNYIDLPYDVAGLASFRGIPIAWTSNQTYRLEGAFDDQGNGSIKAVPIATNIGISGSFSPVVYDNGVVFAAQDGFYLTDGYRIQKINTYWRDTHLNLIRTSTISSQIHGVYERNQRRMWWATNTNGSDNDSCCVLDANFPISENSVFTSVNAKSLSTNFAPTSIGYFKGQIIRGDSRGYVFKHDPSYKSDPKVNTGASPTTWTTDWITYNYQSTFYDFGSLSQRKWNPRVHVKIRNNGNLSLQINLFTDNSTSEKSAMSPLYYRGTGDVIEQRGHVPAGYIRCRNRSVQMTNALVVIQGSDTYGIATLDRVAKTLTLGVSWSGDLVDQTVTFPGDGYTASFIVTAQTGAVLTLSDPGGALPSSGVTKWEIKGYPKDELFQLISYALPVAVLGRNQPVIGATNGANA